MPAISNHPKICTSAEVLMGLWEVGEYVGETLVFIGVVGEVFADWGGTTAQEASKNFKPDARNRTCYLIGLFDRNQ